MIDINERTHEKEVNHFIESCKAFELFSVGFIVICALWSLVLAAKAILTAAGIITNNEMSVIAVIGNNACDIVRFVGIGIALKHGAAIFHKLKSGETPFQYDIGDKIKAAGFILILTNLICNCIYLTFTILYASGIIADNIYEGTLGDGYLCFLGALLCIFSYIFNYGCKLQQESDETL